MNEKNYKLRYLPLFEEDLIAIVDYVIMKLKNPQAAEELVRDVECAIYERLNNPEAFEPYHSLKDRYNSYYRIYVKNYVIYYVVINNVMEVRRILYKARNVKEQI